MLVERRSIVYQVRTTAHDNLLITSVREANASIYGFVGWRWDEDQHLRPLSDQILTTAPSAIVDFTLLRTSKFTSLFEQISAARSNNSPFEHLPILAWCHDEKLRLIEMDFSFRQSYQELTRMKQRAQIQAQAIANFPRLSQAIRRTSLSKTMMDVIEDETSRSEESDCDDISLHDLSSSKAPSFESSETGDENDNSFRSVAHRSNERTISVDLVRINRFIFPRMFRFPTNSIRFRTLTVLTLRSKRKMNSIASASFVAYIR